MERKTFDGARRSAKFAGALVAVILVTALAAMPAFAADARPFAGVFTGNVAFTPTGATYQGSGTATHLGASAIAAVVVPVGPADCDGFAAQHTITLTAANGDQVHIFVEDVSCFESPVQIHGVGTFQVTGGAGRFASATGAGTFEALARLDLGAVTITLNGTIIY